ncbi:MAG: FAD-dependent oxidoreductase [Candidatus Promineifilaceae bacterium]
MSQIGSESQPLRVAIVGAGPAGFYVAEHLLKQKDLVIEIDMFDRLPTPFGLVRNGVAPDHQKIKSVTKAFDRIASKPGYRFFGNVELGTDIAVADLRSHFHQIVYSTGAQTDRYLNIPGIDLKSSHAATQFVAWYNGHPDYRDFEFDLSQETVAVIGIGNVAVDVARILCRSQEELFETDIADHALKALSESRIKDVYMLGRRGPAQGAFTPPELKELGEMQDADVVVLRSEAELDNLSLAAMADADRGTERKVGLIQQFSEREQTGKTRRLHLRFLVSPVELIGDEDDCVKSMKLVRNELYATDAGTLRPKSVDKFEELPVGLVFRSIGYRGVPLADVPYNENWGVIYNEAGRVIKPGTGEPVLGEYTAGWIKRGPSGVIGTNKPDAKETAENMVKDLASGTILSPSQPNGASFETFINDRQPDYFSFADWQRLDELEREQGAAIGRPRIKFTRVDEMIAAKNRQL